MEQKKIEARKKFKEAKSAYLASPTKDNWIRFCEAKRLCMLLGVII